MESSSNLVFLSFVTWEQVLTHVSQDRPIWYKAPFDYQPVRVNCLRWSRKSVRVLPPGLDADPFTADADHLSRFRYRQEAQP